MTRIRMLKTVPVYPDGVTRQMWAAGQIHAASPEILAGLIELGAVEIVEDAAVKAAPETKKPRRRRRVEPQAR